MEQSHLKWDIWIVVCFRYSKSTDGIFFQLEREEKHITCWSLRNLWLKSCIILWHFLWLNWPKNWPCHLPHYVNNQKVKIPSSNLRFSVFYHDFFLIFYSANLMNSSFIVRYPVEGYNPIQDPPVCDHDKAQELFQCLERLLPAVSRNYNWAVWPFFITLMFRLNSASSVEAPPLK